MTTISPSLSLGPRWHLAAMSVGFAVAVALGWSAAHIMVNRADLLDLLPASVGRYVTAPICQMQMFVFAWSLTVVLLERWEARRHLCRDFVGALSSGRKSGPNPVPDSVDGQSALLDFLALHFAQDQRRRMALLQLAIWALPILGFIGTVEGITDAIIGLEKNMSNAGAAGSGGGMTPQGMAEVMGGMKYAFDTTMVGLVLMVPLVVVSTMFKGELETAYTKIQQRVLLLGGIGSSGPPEPADRERMGTAAAATPPQRVEGGDHV